MRAELAAACRSWRERPAGPGGVVTIPLGEVQQRLGLAPLPDRELLGATCWLGGGRVLRWLSGAAMRAGGDVDLYFPSLGALNETTEVLLAHGHRFEGFRSWGFDLCYRCGARLGPAPRRKFPFFRQRPVVPLTCDGCVPLAVARPLEMTQELIDRGRIVAVEMRAPAGDVFQLATVAFHPEAAGLFARTDLTICQVLVDGESLHADVRALEDLAARALRVVHVNHPLATLRRIGKYMRRGFRPSPRTALAVVEAAWRAEHGDAGWRTTLARRLGG